MAKVLSVESSAQALEMDSSDSKSNVFLKEI